MVLTTDEAMDYVHRMESNIAPGLSYQERVRCYENALNRARRSPLTGRSLEQVVGYFSEKVGLLKKDTM